MKIRQGIFHADDGEPPPEEVTEEPEIVDETIGSLLYLNYFILLLLQPDFNYRSYNESN